MISFSLIIPHYNDFVRLKRLLKSLPTRIDLQVLVVDDCSPEQDALNVVKKLFPHVDFFYTPTNQGAGAARNIGLQHAKGEYILFADADDEFLPNAFDILDHELQKDADITYFLAEAWQEEANKSSVRADSFNKVCLDYIANPTEENLLNLRLTHCVPWAKVYNSDFVKKNGVMFDETFVSNDVYFNIISAALANELRVIDKPIYKVYRLSDSLTSTTTSERIIERIRVSAKTADRLKELGISHKRSASGFLLQSVSFGFTTFFKVLWIAIKSDLNLNFLRLIKLERWIGFFKRRNQLNQEKNTR